MNSFTTTRIARSFVSGCSLDGIERGKSSCQDETVTGISARAASGFGRHFTILQGIRPLKRSLVSRDVVAGVTLAALAIPEVMGYTKIAGTPVITGLYTILLPVVVFAVFGSSRHLVVGGDSATAAIMYAGIAGLGISGLQPGTNEWLAFASLAALITGGLLLLARVARLGFLADFISRTVLVGFLTGVGIQVAMGQLAGMLGVPSPKVDLDQTAGTVIKFWDTLKEIPDTSLATFAVSLAVIVTLVVFERGSRHSWRARRGRRSDRGQLGFDLQSHGVSTLGHVPSGLPSIGLPNGVGWNDVGPLLRLRLHVPRDHRAERGHVACLRRQVQGAVRGEHRPRRPRASRTSPPGSAAPSWSTGARRRRKMAEEAKAAPDRACWRWPTTCDRPSLPDEAAPVHAERRPRCGRLRDRHQADRLAHMREIYGVRRDEFWIAAITAAVVVVVGVEQGVILAIVLSLLDHVKRHYDPHDSVVTGRAQRRADDVPPASATPSSRARRVPLRRRPLLRECLAARPGGARSGRRARPPALARPARRRDRRRRLHRWQDARSSSQTSWGNGEWSWPSRRRARWLSTSSTGSE